VVVGRLDCRAPTSITRTDSVRIMVGWRAPPGPPLMSSYVRTPSRGFLFELGPNDERPTVVADGWIRRSGDGWRFLASSADLFHESRRCSIMGTARLNPSSLPTPSARNHHSTHSLALIADLFRDRPTDFVASLDGDFGVVIVDRGDVVAVRDHMGIHQLYYAQGDDHVGIASHLGLLLQLPWVDGSIDEVRVGDYLLSLFEDGESTFYRHVRQVPAGHLLRVTGGRAKVERYWSLDSQDERQLETDDHYVDAFRAEFLRSVADRVQPGSTVGSTLSGGLDSSSVSVAARVALHGEPLHVFSGLVAASDPGNERPFIDQIVRQGGVVPHTVAIDCLAPIGSMEQELGAIEEPIFAPNLFVHRALMKEAQRVGCSVLLDGLDGDTAVSHGLGRLLELARGWRLPTLVHEVRALSRGVLPHRPATILWRSVVRPLALRPLRLAWRHLRPPSEDPWQGEAHVDRDFARTLHLASRYLELSESRTRPCRWQRAEHIARITWPLHQYLLQMLGQLSAALSLESRYPFYDRRLIELAVALPSSLKLRDGWTRYVLRRAMAPLLPKEIAWRVGKSDLGPNFYAAFRHSELGRLESLIADRNHGVWHYADRARTGEAVKDFRNGENRVVMPLWKTLTLAVWMDQNNV